MKSDAISRWIRSKLSRIIGHQAGVGELLLGVRETPFSQHKYTSMHTLELGPESLACIYGCILKSEGSRRRRILGTQHAGENIGRGKR